MKVFAGFHTRGDEWILPFKLQVLSTFCDAIVVCLDRPTEETGRILDRFPKVQAFEHINTLGLPDHCPTRGPLCEEGRMRQETFDAMADLAEDSPPDEPVFFILGDTDEVPTPDIGVFLSLAPRKFPDIDFFDVDIVQLYQGEEQHVSGLRCIWSYEDKRSTKRTMVVRYRRGRKYTYADKPCHVPLKPSMSSPGEVIAARAHQLRTLPKVLHYKFANWERWNASEKAQMQKYKNYWVGLETKPTPEEWLWSPALDWRQR